MDLLPVPTIPIPTQSQPVSPLLEDAKADDPDVQDETENEDPSGPLSPAACDESTPADRAVPAPAVSPEAKTDPELGIFRVVNMNRLITTEVPGQPTMKEFEQNGTFPLPGLVRLSTETRPVSTRAPYPDEPQTQAQPPNPPAVQAPSNHLQVSSHSNHLRVPTTQRDAVTPTPRVTASVAPMERLPPCVTPLRQAHHHQIPSSHHLRVPTAQIAHQPYPGPPVVTSFWHPDSTRNTFPSPAPSPGPSVGSTLSAQQDRFERKVESWRQAHGTEYPLADKRFLNKLLPGMVQWFGGPHAKRKGKKLNYGFVRIHTSFDGTPLPKPVEAKLHFSGIACPHCPHPKADRKSENTGCFRRLKKGDTVYVLLCEDPAREENSFLPFKVMAAYADDKRSYFQCNCSKR